MLHLLLEYSADRGLAVKPAFRAKYIRWAATIDSDGNYLGLLELGRPSNKRNRGERFHLCPHLEQPEIKRGPTGCRHFLVDTAQVVTLYKAAKNTQQQHRFFRSLLEEAAETAASVRPVLAALRNENTLMQLRTAFEGRSAAPTDNITFAVVSDDIIYPVRQSDWHSWWQQYRSRLAEFSTHQMLDFATGEQVLPILSHLVVSGLYSQGGQPAGDRIASYKQGAFRSFGLAQGENAAVSDTTAAAYRAALDYLLDEEGPHSRTLAGARIAYWYAGPGATLLTSEDDPIESLLPMEADDEVTTGDEAATAAPLTAAEHAELQRQTEAQAGERVRRLLDAIRAGERPELVQTRFYALSLAANSGRVVVRDWIQGDFADLAANVIRWMEDLSVTRLDTPGPPTRVPKLEALVTCVLAPRSPGQKYSDWIKPAGKLREPLFREAVGFGRRGVLEEAVRMALPRFRAAVLNGEIEAAVLGKATSQFKDWKQARGRLYARAALFKVFLTRKGGLMETCLRENHPSSAYHYGRLLAVLANVQREALGDVGANVVQRYYARASTAPADALGPLINLSNRHLDKIDRGLADYLQGKIADIFARISDEVPPKTLDTVGQSLFAMGFYQQIARMRQERAANVARKRARGGDVLELTLTVDEE